MRDALATALHVMSATLDSRGALIRPVAEADDRGLDAAVVLAADTHDSRGAWQPIRTRAEAYQRLAEAADFLARTEPHSPVPHLIRRAVGWGSLSLEDLLPELVRDSAQLAEIYRMLQLGEKQPGVWINRSSVLSVSGFSWRVANSYRSQIYA
jgi:predicted component of type VI protein secretion system